MSLAGASPPPPPDNNGDTIKHPDGEPRGENYITLAEALLLLGRNLEAPQVRQIRRKMLNAFSARGRSHNQTSVNQVNVSRKSQTRLPRQIALRHAKDIWTSFVTRFAERERARVRTELLEAARVVAVHHNADAALQQLSDQASEFIEVDDTDDDEDSDDDA
jgi:hypothetical protein